MCLIVFAWKVLPDYPLLLAANRDEFYDRPALPATHWEDFPAIFAGRDLQGGGTWLGITEKKRFAALTNVREPQLTGVAAVSRGRLVFDFLRENTAAADFATTIEHAAYAGFNLLLYDGNHLIYTSNRGDKESLPLCLPPGIYTLSNDQIDTPWPKTEKVRARFSAALKAFPSTAPFFDLLSDTEIAPDEHLPKTGVSLEWERRLSPIFIASETYGTRASTLVWQTRDGDLHLCEKIFNPQRSHSNPSTKRLSKKGCSL